MNKPARDIGTSGSPMRLDIQFLRGIAVLAVLFYHSDLIPLSGGFLGVDIFFVISGYLITRNIIHDIDQQRFSFATFYSRRARRLLPAAYCTLAVTSLLAAAVLTQQRWSDFLAQLLGALTFTANVVLPLQTGYFETTADTKPLLHTWSLSVEEQYYLFAPLLLVLIRPRWRIATLAGIAAASLALCLVFASWRFGHWRLPQLDSQQFAFFMLPARAWELMAGSLLACASSKRPPIDLAPAIKWALALLLLALCVHPFDSVHPRGDAIAVVSITVLLIAGGYRWLGGSAAVRAVAKVGDWSYSLYLVHWPLFSLAHSAYLGEIPAPVRATLVVLSLVLAWLQYEFVEQRFLHRGATNRISLVRVGIASMAVAVLPFGLSAVRAASDTGAYAYLHESNRGLSAQCANGAAIENPRACSTADRPRVVVWGDSYAMHLIPGLRSLDAVGDSLLQVTKTACAPIRGIASIDANFDEAWARSCVAFNEQAFELIVGTESVRYVVLSSPYTGYLDAGKLTLLHDGAAKVGYRQLAVDALERTVRELQAHGKQPILVAPPPRPGFDVGACHEQQGSGLIVLGRSDCNFRAEDAARMQAGIVDGLKQVGARTNANVQWLDEVICSDGLCRTANPEAMSIYKDDGHLSIPGSTWLLPQTGIAALFGP
jgi:peptidoglycan/LPS O-acetylase OafA/YrhL